MKTSRHLRVTGTDAERLLLAAGLSERPDLGSVRRAAQRLGFLPGLLMFGGAITLALRTARWSSTAARGLVPLAGFGAVAIVAYGVVARPASSLPSDAAQAGANVAGATGNARRLDAVAPIGAPEMTAGGSIDVAGPPAGLVVASSVVAAPRHPAVGATKAARSRAATLFSADGLRQQAELLDRARARIASGDPGSAMALLDDYDRRFAGAPLAEESLLLRVEALARRGDRSGASSLGGQFLKAYPASVHADRVRALLHALSP